MENNLLHISVGGELKEYRDPEKFCELVIKMMGKLEARRNEMMPLIIEKEEGVVDMRIKSSGFRAVILVRGTMPWYQGLEPRD
eukprot:snap_masked-scaffold_97-processed-gene-0.12-mRNA-1 protein AED:1.00 eAED:1.00 QI:0/-1/0/0/-1/1/1/0/82